MQRTRVIPVLLLQDGGLVKSVRFSNHKYVGDPINAVKIFNDKEVDEIAIIDISASAKGQFPDVKVVHEMASEAFMPLAYGGGIRSIEQIRAVLYHGAEKVILQSAFWETPQLIADAARKFGSQSIVVCLDYKVDWLGKRKVYYQNGKKKRGSKLIDAVQQVESLGAGEIILQSIERDGTFNGYDLQTIREVSDSVSIPVIALGGASGLKNMKEAVDHGASAVAAGSYFVFQMPHRAVLISYPTEEDLIREGLINIKSV